MKNLTILKTKFLAVTLVIVSFMGLSTGLFAQASITISPGTLNGFNYIVNNGPSASQSFVVSGINLTANIILTPSASYEISIVPDQDFGSTVTLVQSGGLVLDKTIYVRLKPGLFIYDYLEDITASSVGATSKTLTCSGSVNCVPSDLAFAETEITKTLNSPAFTQKAVSFSITPALTYSSSNTSVATVDAEGTVTIGSSTGQITITASHVAGSGLCSGTTFYTLNVVSTPILIVSPATLSSFSAISGSFPSAEQSFTVSGSLLINNIDLTSPANYEISTVSGSNYSSSLTLTHMSGVVPNTTIYVRLKAGLPVLDYNNEILAVTSTFAASKSVVCNGKVDPAASNLDFGTAISKALDSPKFIRTATSLNATTAISYSGSDNNVATIDPVSGEVTLVGLGEVTLTATQVAGIHNSVDYQATTASYTLTVYSGPLVTTSTNALAGFSYSAGTGPSVAQNFTVSGNNLTGDITLTVPEYYEISTSLGSNFVQTVTLTQVSGSVSVTPIYVRLKVGLFIYNYTENILITSQNAFDKSVTCNGSVTCAISVLAFSESVLTKTVDNPNFVHPITIPVGRVAIYSSSNPSVATVNTTGEVDVLSVGSTEITASHEAGGGLCAATTFYTLNVIQTPLLIVSTTSLNGFSALSGIVPSAELLFAVSGSLLTNNIAIAAPANYEISKTAGSAFGPTVTLIQESGVVASTTIYVRLKAGLAVADYNNEAITVTSTYAESKSVECSGSVNRAASNLNFGTALSKALDSPKFLRIASSLNSTTVISYSGSDNNVATIDPASGEVTIVGLGEVVLTATQIAGIHNSVEYNASTASYTLTVYSGPFAAVSTSALTGFTYSAGAGPSEVQSFTVSGSNLTGDIMLTAPTDFEISTIAGTGFGATISLTQVSGVVPETLIYVRLKTGLYILNYAENILISSLSAFDKTVACSGSVTCGISLLAFSESIVSKTVENPNFIPLVFKPAGVLLIYSSSNPLVATINESGEVDLLSVGSTEIHVSHDAGAGLCAATTFFTLNVVQTPLLTVTPTSLNDFAAVSGVLPSSEKTFTVGGSLLINDIILTAPADYEISTTTGSGFGSSVTLTQVSGNVVATSIYARLKAGLPVADYNNESLTIASDLAVPKVVSCNGSVTCAASQLAFLVTHVDKTMGNAPFSVATTSDNGTTTIGYFSSAPSVASVNVNTGEVTLVGEGLVEITATQTAGSHNSVEYCTSSAAFTLTVAVGPTIVVTPATISDFTYTAGSPAPERSFIVSGNLLTNDIVITPPSNYQISTGIGEAFVPVNEIVLARTGTVVAATTIYARLKTEINVGAYSENIALTSVDAVAKSVACSGNVLCYPYNLEFGVSIVTKAPGDAAFTEVATTLRPLAIEYSSSVPGVATINSSTGEVTVIATGSTVITASQAEGGGYCGEMDTYILNVGVPTITVAETLIPGMSAEVGATDNETITVNGVNLTADITVAIENPSLFVLSVENLAQTGGIVLNKPVTITYSPGVVGIQTTTLTLSSAGAIDIIREISGTATSGPVTGVNQGSVDLKVSALNGKMKFLASVGDKIEVFNAIGQKLVSQLAVDGMNTITVSAHGLILLKVGNRVAKVIL